MGKREMSSEQERGVMLPVVCRCCGLVMAKSASDNPHICAECARMDWSDEAPGGDLPAAIHPAASQLEQFLELDEPSMVECVEALEQAKRALTETVAAEASACTDQPVSIGLPSDLS